MAISLLRAISFLPHSVMMKIGSSLGNLLYKVMDKRRHVAETNLKLCFPTLSKNDIAQLTSQHFQMLGKALMDVAIAWWWSDKRINQLNIQVHGLEKLATDNTATIFLTAHFSSLELSARLLGRYAKTLAMYRPHENAVIQYHYEKYRSKYSEGILAKQDVRKTLAALKTNKGIWFAPDQNFKGKGFIFSTFFGVPAATNTATSRFAKLGDAIIQPFALFSKESGYELHFENPLLAATGENIESETQMINKQYEKWIIKNIPQYNWIHKRFKDQPNGQSPYLKS
jgi:KDO2-lipid IV(A) lauroyltransferase